jgi:arylsulfatase A-like enzyme
MRRHSPAWIVFALISASLASARPPNILILYTDDQGYGDVGCFGCRDIDTPNTDRLAASGVRLSNYYSAAPICAPSRAALLTGRYPSRIGMSTTQNISSDIGAPGISTHEVTIAELARARGYATAVFGKWHLGASYDTQPNAQGFDLFLGHHASCIDSYSHMYYASLPYHHDLYRNREEIHEDGQHMTDLITRETVGFIEKNRDRPFLIYVAYNTPHYPMVAPGRFFERYAHLPVPRRWQAALVAHIDESIGRIMDELRRQDLVEDTFVFFSSDNGAADPSPRGEGGGSNAPFREFKRSLFDGGIHMPAIVSWPGQVPAGEVRRQIAIAMDVFATAAEIIGADPPDDRVIDGRSWMPFLRDPEALETHENLFFEWDDQQAVRHGPWKVVRNGLIDQATAGRNNRATGDDFIFLSNLDADPGEQKNLCASHPELARRLLTAHQEWCRSVSRNPVSTPSP